jgi:ABC-type lipoprotein release transport system permease subunit
MVNITQIDVHGDDIDSNEEGQDTSVIMVQCETKDVLQVRELIREALRKSLKRNTNTDTWKSYIKSFFTKEVLEENISGLIEVLKFRVYDVVIVLCIAFLCKRFAIFKTLLG